MLSYPVTGKEVFDGLGRMKPFKAPSPDGMHASFYQRNWNIVKEVVVREVCSIFSSGVMPNHLNQTLITLIPKCTGDDYLGLFRPISLCNTIYKIVTKLIVQRIRPLLDKLVSPLQIAFVLGRRGLDNMIIVQKLIHTMSTKKGNQGYMAIKIDLEKAYDRLEWHFIPPDTVKLIMSCISGSSISVLLNGGKLDPNLPSRGIRQGDPFSPYLFILCMEFLGHLIEEKCALPSCGLLLKLLVLAQLFLVFFFFADDLVLFASANSENCAAISSALQEFCAKSGQKVSEAKSRVFFSPNVDPKERETLTSILGFNSTNNLGKYLGFPIKQPGRQGHEFGSILDRVKKKLAGWKANLLSMAGRMVLIQASSSAIPSYVM